MAKTLNLKKIATTTKQCTDLARLITMAISVVIMNSEITIRPLVFEFIYHL